MLLCKKALRTVPSCLISIVLSTGIAFAQNTSVSLQPPVAAVHQIIPSDTDPRINTFSGQGFTHWSWYLPNVPDTGQLVVFLPGTGGKGNGSAPFNSTAMSMGYHVLCLSYPDSLSMSMFHGSDDEAAFSKARANVITGKVQFGNIGVDEANSIENRLVMALRYISHTYPNEHWSQFLDRGGSVAWDRTILSGQSQGGGHACFMAMKLHKVARVLMFGSPKDFNVYYNKPGAWFSEGSATPLNRFFSFVHELDGHNGCTYPQQLSIYQAMKLMTQYSVIDVDRISYPYNHSRLLTSSCDQKNAHVAPIHDERYVNAWKYLLSEPVQ